MLEIIKDYRKVIMASILFVLIGLGFFFFIHGLLELTDPITMYLLDTKE